MRVTPAHRDLDLGKSDLVRAPGLHASDAYGALYKFLEPERFNTDGPPNATLMLLGSAFEDRVEKVLRWNGVDCYRPGEFSNEYVQGFSPDLLIFEPPVIRVGEIKLTSMSFKEFPPMDQVSNYFPPKVDKHMCQMMLYAKWLELSHGCYIICSIRQPWKPELRCYNIEWTARELQENEDMVLNFAASEGLL